MTLEAKFNTLAQYVLNGDPEARKQLEAALAEGTTANEIGGVLLEIGIPDRLLGHSYLARAVELVAEDPDLIRAITKELYPQVAKAFDTTPSRVERAMRHAIEVAWIRGDWDTLRRYFGNSVDSRKGKPTNSEFIARIVNVLR